MNGDRKSDSPIVPKTTANKDRDDNRSAESDEGRGLTKGNSDKHDRCRTQSRENLQNALDRIREAAERDNEQQFTALWHHVANVDRLRKAFNSTRRNAAAGLDGVTWEQYAEDLEEHLKDLCGRLHRGAYRAKPVLRRYIPKPDGRQRPLGIPVLEDKIVQKATAEVLNAIYETDFMGFSYGFRPGRSQHNALDALYEGIRTRKVGWVLDADIRGFFDAIDHEWLIKSEKSTSRLAREGSGAGRIPDVTPHRIPTQRQSAAVACRYKTSS